AEPAYAVVRDFDRAHPLLRFADLSEAIVGLDPAWEPWPADEEGWRVLARTSDLTPVIRVREQGPLALEFAFHPSQTDLTLRPAFPALFANVVAALGTTEAVRLGEAAEGGGPWLEPGVHELEDGTVVLGSLLSAGESRLPREASGDARRAAPADAPSAEPAAQPAGDEVAERAPRQGATAPAGGAPTPPATVLAALALLALLVEWVLRTTRFAAG